jgi:FkbM family methyltransferase
MEQRARTRRPVESCFLSFFCVDTFNILILVRLHLNKLLRRFGYNVSRVPANRFDATADSLNLLRSFGFTPRVIVDAGANMGEWTRMVYSIFPSATYHLIEPQPGCHASLRSLVSEITGQLHMVAVTEPQVGAINIAGDGLGNTGAYICSPTDREDTIQVPANTLDELVTVTGSDRALVKLDLETHELVALRGAENLLSACEVVLTEVSFYHANAPLFLDTAIFMRKHGFELYDFATLSAPISHRRLRSGDAIFVKASSPLLSCRAV